MERRLTGVVVWWVPTIFAVVVVGCMAVEDGEEAEQRPAGGPVDIVDEPGPSAAFGDAVQRDVFTNDDCNEGPSTLVAAAPLTLQDGLMLHDQARGLAVVDASVLPPRLLTWHPAWSSPVMALGDRRVLVGELGDRAYVEGRPPRLWTLDFADPLEPVVLGSWDIVANLQAGVSWQGPDGWTAVAPSGRADGELVVVHVDLDGGFTEARVSVGAPIQRLASAGQGLVVAWIDVRGPCEPSAGVTCDVARYELAVVDVSRVEAPTVWSRRVVSTFSIQSVDRHGDVLRVIGSRPESVWVQTVRVSDHARLGAVSIDMRLTGGQVEVLGDGALAVWGPLQSEEAGLWVVETPSDGPPITRSSRTWRSLGLLKVVAVEQGRRLLTLDSDRLELLDPGVDGGPMVVLDVGTGCVASERDRRMWHLPSSATAAETVFVACDAREQIWFGSSRLVAVGVHGDELRVDEVMSTSDMIWDVEARSEGRLGVTTESSWYAVKRDGGFEAWMPILRDDRAVFEVGGRRLRHRSARELAEAHARWNPDGLELLPPGGDPNMVEAEEVVELPERSQVFRVGERLVVLGADRDGQGVVELWDAGGPEAPERLGRLVSSELALAVPGIVEVDMVRHEPVVDPSGRWLVAVPHFPRGGGRGRVFVVDLEGGPRLREVPLAEDEVVIRMVVDEGAVTLAIFLEEGGQGRVVLRRLVLDEADGPRLGAPEPIPGELLAMRGGRMVTWLVPPGEQPTTLYLLQRGDAGIEVVDALDVGEHFVSAVVGERGDVLVGLNARGGRELRVLRVGVGDRLSAPSGELRFNAGGAVVASFGSWGAVHTGAGSWAVELAPDGGLRLGPALPGPVVGVEAASGGWWVAGGLKGVAFVAEP